MLPHANSLSISSVSIFGNFIIELFPTTILWVYFVKLSAEHISNISLATPKWFQGKTQIRMNCSIQGNHKKLFTKSHGMIETTWVCLSFWLANHAILSEKNQYMSICGLFLWYPHVINFFIFSWNFDSCCSSVFF